MGRMTSHLFHPLTGFPSNKPFRVDLPIQNGDFPPNTPTIHERPFRHRSYRSYRSSPPWPRWHRPRHGTRTPEIKVMAELDTVYGCV